jgi:threonine aldolase
VWGFGRALSPEAQVRYAHVGAIDTERGLLSVGEVIRNLRPVSPYSAPTGAVSIEQTHNMAGGTVYPMRTVCEICDVSHDGLLDLRD